jgi:hypothetical protein
MKQASGLTRKKLVIMDTMPGRNGGTLTKQKKGEPPPAGAGRPPKSDILAEVGEMMEGDGWAVIEGDLLDENEKPTGQKAKIRARIPNAKDAARAWMTKVKKADPALLKLYMEYKYGKPKQQLEHTGADGKDLFPQFANQPIQVEIIKTTNE